MAAVDRFDRTRSSYTAWKAKHRGRPQLQVHRREELEPAITLTGRVVPARAAADDVPQDFDPLEWLLAQDHTAPVAHVAPDKPPAPPIVDALPHIGPPSLRRKLTGLSAPAYYQVSLEHRTPIGRGLRDRVRWSGVFESTDPGEILRFVAGMPRGTVSVTRAENDTAPMMTVWTGTVE
jgi:hypothetical protein